MEIARMWTLSTAHISRETDKWLIGQVKEPTEGLCVYKKTGGYFVYVPDDFDYEEMNLPEDIETIIAFAIGCGVDWILSSVYKICCRERFRN